MPLLRVFVVDGFRYCFWAGIALHCLRIGPALWREMLFKINYLSLAEKWVQKRRRAACISVPKKCQIPGV
jgi:hypothetical protein